MADWPRYPRETAENLDTHLMSYDEEVPGANYQVQVVPFPGRSVSGGWQPYPYRIQGLPVGRYDGWTQWERGDGQKVIDHIGPEGMPSFEIT
jgi:hypothetical protein